MCCPPLFGVFYLNIIEPDLDTDKKLRQGYRKYAITWLHRHTCGVNHEPNRFT